MKTHLSLTLAVLITATAVAATGDVNVRLKNASVSQTLRIYASLTGLELVISPEATNQTKTVTLDINFALPKNEAAKKVAAALREQADVVIKPIDEKKASVARTKAPK